MTKLALAGNFIDAMKVHHKLFPLVKTLFLDGNPVGIKYAMKVAGMDTGAGFLMDVLGNDTYEGHHNSVNGGASAGVGLLFDGAGHDTRASALGALILVPLWLFVWNGHVALGGPFIPTDWHIHEMIWGFGAAVLFGMHKPLRGFAGGIAIGIVQAVSAGYLPGAWATAAPLLFIMVVLAAGRLNVAQVAGGRA